VHHLLGIVENLCELDDDMTDTLFHKTPLVPWLLKALAVCGGCCLREGE
jgi:hypothetical protein